MENNLIRLDIALSKKENLSRVMAKDFILQGKVSVEGKVINSPGYKIDEDKLKDIKVENDEYIFVSRGGFKLQKSVVEFSVLLENRICADIGASTGGFTDCMLLNGAKKVYAIDTGTNQLAQKLQDDSRVVSMEQTDVRNIRLPEEIDFAAIDVSFISIEKIIENIFNILKDDGKGIFLVKPQFEAGKGVVNKKGIIKNSKIHYKTLINVYNYAMATGFFVKGLIPSPIEGGSGNKEFLMHMSKSESYGALDRVGFEKRAKEVCSIVTK